MTVQDVIRLQNNGQIEEAYDAIRTLYSACKDRYTSLCMFWTALEMLKKHIKEGRSEEARKIFLALACLLERTPDDKAQKALEAVKPKLDALSQTGRPDRLAYHAALGKWGEDTATVYLQDKGYTIVERDWHSAHRDIDIIATDGDMLVFVEVKTRSNDFFGTPEQAVDYRKQQNLRHAINHFLKYHHTDLPWRFDVITVIGTIGTQPAINHIEDFSLSMR